MLASYNVASRRSIAWFRDMKLITRYLRLSTCFYRNGRDLIVSDMNNKRLVQRMAGLHLSFTLTYATAVQRMAGLHSSYTFDICHLCAENGRAFISSKSFS